MKGLENNRIGISYSDYYLPGKYLGVNEFFNSLKNFSLPEGYSDMESFCESFYKQKKITGVYVEEEKEEVEIFENLVAGFFEDSGVRPEDIDILIYTKGVPIHACKVNVPYYIHKKFDLKRDVVTFNVDQTCGASLTSIHVAESLIRTGRYRSALILSSSLIKELEKRNVQVTLISDAAGVLYIESNPRKLLIRDYLSRTTGSYSFTIESFTKRGNYRELVNYIADGAETMKELLRRNNLDFEAIKVICPQNTTYGGYEIYASLLGIDIRKVFLDNIPKGAHTGDVDTIRNLTDITGQKVVKKGELMIAYGLGWGTSWNAALLEMLQE
ncbi:MAG: 3-oxoacyl-[acyl-carrier-protein] synthase III C-terminal domain-containing protein [Peptococcaceae bacterium]|jgi:3-oxoacyl-[acyl-carrier-protein] synthase-3|nr:hypothetical protein [Peptococcaceae bacterium]MDH7525029.1 3-oxoacyl-[acyl-carrier-protein] synthase III C-terminal domain-containing protein [Peptococcaceae bacterium]